MLKTIFALLLLPLSLPLFSQKYRTAAGLRLGGGIGITAQQALWGHYTAEVQWQKGFTNNRTIITALLEQHHGILSKGTNFYLGIGAHAGSDDAVGKEKAGATVFGLSGIGGMEFTLGRTILSADIKPVINLSGANRILETQTGVSFRYVFIKAPKNTPKWMFWKRKQNKQKE